MKDFFRKNYNCPSCGGLIKASVWSSVSRCKNCGIPLFEVFVDSKSRARKIVEVVIFIVYIFSIIEKEFLIGIHPFLPVAALILFGAMLFSPGSSRKSILKINEAIDQQHILSIQERIRDLNRFLSKKITPLDFFDIVPDVRQKAGLEGLLSPLIKIHSERIGGLTVEEQLQAIKQIKPDLDLDELVRAEVDKANAEIQRLKAFTAETE